VNIGVFDSGLGGLTILRELLKKLPQYSYVYLGDNARVPYGGRSAEKIYEFTTQALRFLFKKNCKLVILACNTSTSTSLRRIQHEFLPRYFPDRKVLGVIKPVIEELEKAKGQSSKFKSTPIRSGSSSKPKILKKVKIGVIGTKATVNSGAFVREIHKILPKAQVIQQAGPLLVPFIEEGETDSPAFSLVLKQYLSIFKKKEIDTLILACTHYGIVKNQIKKIMGKNIGVIDEGVYVAEKLKKYLRKHKETETKLIKASKRDYYVTDVITGYQPLIKLFLDLKNVIMMQTKIDV